MQEKRLYMFFKFFILMFIITTICSYYILKIMSVVYIKAQPQVQCNWSIFFFQPSCLAWPTLKLQYDSGG